MNLPIDSPWAMIAAFFVTLAAVLLTFYYFVVRKFTPTNPDSAALLQRVGELGDAQKRQAHQVALFSEYHQQGLDQSRIAFVCSVLFAAMGFLVIVGSLAYLLGAESPHLRALAAELATAKTQHEKAESNLRTVTAESRAESARQVQQANAARQQANALEVEVNQLREEYARLSEASLDAVVPLPSSIIYGQKGDTFQSYLDPEAVRSSLRSLAGNVRGELLRVYLAAIPVLTNQAAMLKTNIAPFITSTRRETNFLQQAEGLILHAPGESIAARNLQRFIELIVRSQVAEEQLELNEKATAAVPGVDKGYGPVRSYEAESSLASQLRAILDGLGRLRRSFELLHEARIDPAFAIKYDSAESTNRLLRATLISRFKDLEKQALTNKSFFYFPGADQATNAAVVEATRDVALAREAVKSLQMQITELGKSTSNTESKSSEKPLAILGVIAGTIIEAIAGLFFVQSNRARELMVQFFDRLRDDRKLDEAIRLADTVPEAATKSTLLRELSLLLARNDPMPLAPAGPTDKPKPSGT